MGKMFIIIAVAFTVTTGSLLLTGPMRSAQDGEEQLVEHGAEALAREAALAGFNRARQAIMSRALTPGDSRFEGSYAEGTYDVRITGNVSDTSVAGSDWYAPPNPLPTQSQLDNKLECVQDNGDGTFTAFFGYGNDYGSDIYLPHGDYNRLSPEKFEGQQPTRFPVPNVYAWRPDRTPFFPGYVFSVTFDEGESVTWHLANGAETASPDKASSYCTEEEPQRWEPDYGLPSYGTAVVRSVGEVPMHDGRTARHVISARFDVQREAAGTSDEADSGTNPPELPAAFEYAVLADGNINFNGSSQSFPPGWPDFESHGLEPSNADIHSNERLTVNGGAVFNGFGTFSAHVGDQGILDRTMPKFQPPHNPDSLDTYRQIPRITIPQFNPELFRSIADEVHHGNKIYHKETIQGGTQDNPRIIYITGELQIKNGVEIRDHVIFCVRGNIILKGGFGNQSTTQQQNFIAFYTPGTLNVNGASWIEGTIRSGRLNINGASRLYGSIIVDDHINFNGSMEIFARRAHVELTQPFCEAGEATYCGEEEDQPEPEVVVVERLAQTSYREHSRTE